MTEQIDNLEGPDFESVRLKSGVKGRLDDMQVTLKKVRSKKPTLSQVVDHALDALTHKLAGEKGAGQSEVACSNCGTIVNVPSLPASDSADTHGGNVRIDTHKKPLFKSKNVSNRLESRVNLFIESLYELGEDDESEISTIDHGLAHLTAVAEWPRTAAGRQEKLEERTRKASATTHGGKLRARRGGAT